jgi:hypothetical protein
MAQTVPTHLALEADTVMAAEVLVWMLTALGMPDTSETRATLGCTLEAVFEGLKVEGY